VKSLTLDKRSVQAQIAISKLLSAAALTQDAIDTATAACATQPVVPAACEQLASLHADAGNRSELERVLQTLRAVAPASAPTHYYAAVAAFLRGDPQASLDSAQQAIAANQTYAAAYDVAGAAHTKLGQGELAAQAFQTSLRFDPHDSTAYTNLGLLALAAGRMSDARNFFAEALWLTPNSQAAREGLSRAR
jgi:tetratricopeptide (TPR) repeat protein